MKPVLLDLFCKAGGCTKGYQRAGFYVVGVDIEPQPNYCGDKFWQADALEFLQLDWPQDVRSNFDVIHASPPCQGRSTLKAASRHIYHPDLVVPIRELLQASGLPYVIENVQGDMSGSPLIEPITLCGSSFGLPLRRHRLFESNVPMMSPGCAHGQLAAKYEHFRHGKTLITPFVPVYGTGGGKSAEHWAEAMGIDWMTRVELAQAIPPAYTEHIGHYLMAEVNARAAA